MSSRNRALPLLLTAGFAVTTLTGCNGSDSTRSVSASVAQASPGAAATTADAEAGGPSTAASASPAPSAPANGTTAPSGSASARPGATRQPGTNGTNGTSKPSQSPRKPGAPTSQPPSGGQAPKPGYPAGSGEKAIAAALQAAKADGKEVLLDFGANWCGNCRAADKAFATPSVAGILNDSYHLVKIDIGGQDSANFAQLRKYSSGGGSYKMPVLIVVSPSGQVRTDTHATGNPQLTVDGLSAFLRTWAK
ncbi:thioredoxin family protein [Streptomyces sp. NPDC051211]|uniref:thioredoxin family protein n=1 Tax=Streptomyces sp. NPDC051211 TaxID=3154643 RepID=UPI0034510DB6